MKARLVHVKISYLSRVIENTTNDKNIILWLEDYLKTSHKLSNNPESITNYKLISYNLYRGIYNEGILKLEFENYPDKIKIGLSGFKKYIRNHKYCLNFNEMKNLETLFNLSLEKEEIQNKRNEIQEKYEINKSTIQELLKDPEFKFFLDKKLEEGIDEFELNKEKSGDQYNNLKYSSSNSDSGKIESGFYKMKNPNSPFIPTEDDWEFISLERNKEGKYKLTVDNIKGRQHIGAFTWIPDYYSTDWFTI